MGDLIHGLNCPKFVVCVHEADEENIGRDQIFQPAGACLSVDGNELDSIAQPLQYYLRMEDAVMLGGPEKDSRPSFVFICQGRSDDREIGGFSAARGEDHFGKKAAKLAAKDFPGFIDGLSGAPSF